MAEQFYTILTNTGKAKWAAALSDGSNIQLSIMALGSGLNESYYNPVEAQVALKTEVWRGPISSITVSDENPNWIILEAVILATVGGWNGREVGVFDVDGDMIAIGKFPETYKPQYADGSTKDLWVKVYLEVSNTSVITFNLDTSIACATAQTVVNAISAHHAELDPHPQYLSQPDMDAHVASSDPHPVYATKNNLSTHNISPDAHEDIRALITGGIKINRAIRYYHAQF